MSKFLRKRRQSHRFTGKLMNVTELQLKAYALAVKTLNPNSRWFAEDCSDLAALYLRKTDAQCRESIGRLSNVVDKATIARNCKL